MQQDKNHVSFFSRTVSQIISFQTSYIKIYLKIYNFLFPQYILIAIFFFFEKSTINIQIKKISPNQISIKSSFQAFSLFVSFFLSFPFPSFFFLGKISDEILSNSPFLECIIIMKYFLEMSLFKYRLKKYLLIKIWKSTTSFSSLSLITLLPEIFTHQLKFLKTLF